MVRCEVTIKFTRSLSKQLSQSVRCKVFFQASCFGGQLSQWRVCLVVSLHGDQFTAVSLRRPVVVYQTNTTHSFIVYIFYLSLYPPYSVHNLYKSENTVLSKSISRLLTFLASFLATKKNTLCTGLTAT